MIPGQSWVLPLGACLLSLSAEEPRVRVPRGEVDRPGGAAWLIHHRPQQAWQHGRQLFAREFTRRDGAGEPSDRERLADGTPAMRMGRATSCALCHNTPFGDAGAGATIGRIGPSGRSTPHLYGAGLLESLAESISRHLVTAVDADGDGIIAHGEATGRRAVAPTGDGGSVDYGRYDDADRDGAPDLDPAVRWWPVDATGKRLPGARLDASEVAGYRLALMAYGWSGEDPSADGSISLRTFLAGAFAMHAGLQAQDCASASPCGAPESVYRPAFDGGRVRDGAGTSLDDPDQDGVVAELSAGDLDLVEWYLLAHPAPREQRVEATQAGRRHFTAIGCSDCHVPAWTPPVPVAERRVPGVAATLGHVSGLYSDLRHHDLGPGFHQVRWDGRVITRFRTPPLWGVATSAPYGHDGASLDLDEVIRRHGGEATAAARGYAALTDSERGELLAFLASLTLWRIPPPTSDEQREWLMDADRDGFADALYPR